MPKTQTSAIPQIHGLRKHAGGALDAVNTHATAGDDALSPTDIGATVQPVFHLTSKTAQNVPNVVVLTVTETETPAANKVFDVFIVKGKLISNPPVNALGAIRVTYSDATTVTSATGTSSAAFAQTLIPSFRDRSGTTAWQNAGATENLDVMNDFAAIFTPNGKTITKVELLTARSAAGGAVPTYDWRFAGTET